MTLSGFLLTQGGGSHRRDVGRILFWKRTRPTPRKKSIRAFRLRPGPPNDTKAGGLGPRLWKPIPKGARARLAFAPQRPGQQPESTVTATRFPALMGRQSCRFLESGPLYPPLAALSSLSPIPPLETPPRARRGSGSGKKSMGCPICTPLCSAPTGAGDAVLGRTDIAQPAGDFRILSAVRDGQPPFWVS